MSEERTARDPFVGLNRLIERRAEETQRSWYAIQAVLPKKVFAGYCEIWVNGGTVRGDAFVTRPEEAVQSKVPLSAGDEVLLLRSGDAQTYYLIERMVKL